MFKGYLHKSAANKNKTELAQTVLIPFRNTLKEHYSHLLFQQQQGFPILKRTKLKQKDFKTQVSARQIQSLYTQVLAIFESQQAHLEKKVKIMIYCSSLNDFEKEVLFRINKYHNWYKDEIKWKAWVDENGEINFHHFGKEVNYTVPDELLKLSRILIKQAKRKRKRPNLNHINTFSLDSKVIDLVESKKAKHFEYFAKLSLLPQYKGKKQKPIELPLYNNSYFLENLKTGERRKSLQLSFKDNEVFVTSILEFENAPLRDSGEVIGLDWGLNSLFTDNKGNMFGKKLMRRLRGLDFELITLQKQLQSDGIKPSTSPEYNRFNKKIRRLLKNEIGRMLNKLTPTEVSELVVEDLNFQFGGLSRQLNRILKRSGRTLIREKLESLTESKGIKITKVNPAYTSQMCSNCGFLNKKNRKTQAQFKCLCCGMTKNADVNAAINILQRRSLNISLFIKHAKLKVMLHQKHKDNCLKCSLLSTSG